MNDATSSESFSPARETTGSALPDDYVRIVVGAPFVPKIDPIRYCTEIANRFVLSESADERPHLDHDSLGAGYTYLGQFLAHDVSWIDPVATGFRNARSLPLRLESLYGSGPSRNPWFFDPAAPSCFLIGGREDPTRRRDPRDVSPPPWRANYLQTDRDLIRNGRGVAILPDPRNDLTVLISQVTLAMQLAHNAIAASIRAPGGDHPARFEAARRELKRRYHHVISCDYLPLILHERVAERLDSLKSGTQRLTTWSEARERLVKAGTTKVPLEFAFAAFRFGHTLVRPSYSLSEEIRAPVGLMPVVEGQSPTSSLGGGRPLPDRWTIDWSFFLPNEDGSVLPPPPGLKVRMQRARRIDTKISHVMSRVPPSTMPGLPESRRRVSPVFATLWRGLRMGLPSGRVVASHLAGRFPSLVRGPDFDPRDGELPLWAWLLHEAEAGGDCGGNGRTLGLVGSILVFESIVAMLAADPECYLHTDPKWVPSDAKKGRYTMRTLLETGWRDELDQRS